MEEHVYNVTSDDVKTDDNVVLVINDWYDCSDTCNYVLPVSESPSVPYTIVDEDNVDDKEVYHNVSYTL